MLYSCFTQLYSCFTTQVLFCAHHLDRRPQDGHALLSFTRLHSCFTHSCFTRSLLNFTRALLVHFFARLMRYRCRFAGRRKAYIYIYALLTLYLCRPGRSIPPNSCVCVCVCVCVCMCVCVCANAVLTLLMYWRFYGCRAAGSCVPANVGPAHTHGVCPMLDCFTRALLML